MGFEKQRIVDANLIEGFKKRKKQLRCHICGHRFVVGENYAWRFMQNSRCSNFMTCDTCDTPDVKEKWEKINEELEALKERFWWYEEENESFKIDSYDVYR